MPGLSSDWLGERNINSRKRPEVLYFRDESNSLCGARDRGSWKAF